MTRLVVSNNYNSQEPLRVAYRFNLFRLTSNTGGTLMLRLSPASQYIYVDLDRYATNAWHVVEIKGVIHSFSAKGAVRPQIKASPTDPITGGGVFIADWDMWVESHSPGIPQKTASGAYDLAATDNGKHIYISTGGVTIPNNSDSNFQVDYTVTIINNSGSTQAISKGGSVSLYLSGDAVTATSLTLAARGIATLVKVDTDTWVASGSVSK